MKNKTTIRILGKNYIVCGVECEEYLARVGEFTKDRIGLMREMYPQTSTTDAAILAALNIADELLKLRDEHIVLDRRIDNLVQEAKKTGGNGQAG